MTTIISAAIRFIEVTERPEGADLWLTPAHFEAVTGFALKPEGFCRDALCVPMPPARATQLRRGSASNSAINIAAFAASDGTAMGRQRRGRLLGARRTGRSAQRRVAVTRSAGFRTAGSATESPHRLSDYRGLKVLLASWASW